MSFLKRASIGVLLAWSAFGNAALAPSAVHLRDLDTMVNFVRDHHFVATTLESINLTSLSVFYNTDCEAKFTRRKPSLLKLAQPGPQPKIEFESSNCPLTEVEMKSDQ